MNVDHQREPITLMARLMTWARRSIERSEWITMWVLINVALLVAAVVNRHAESPEVFFDKAREIASLHFPTSNFYPIGSAILVLPFAYLPMGGLLSVLFYANLGFVFLARLARDMLSPLGLRVGAVLLLSNTYLFWTLVGNRDTVLEFAVVIVAVWALRTKRLALWVTASSLAVLVRPGNVLWVLAVSVILSVRWRRLRSLAPLGVLAVVMVINMIVYHSPALSLNGGYAIRIGWTQEHLMTNPLYDYDVGVSDPYALQDRRSLTEAQVNTRYLEQARRAITEAPLRSVQLAMSKLESSLFHISKVPRFDFPASSDGRGGVAVADITSSPSRLVAEVVYFFHRAVAVTLFLFAVCAWLLLPMGRRLTRDTVLLAPFLGAVPMAVLVTSDTRFQITAEIVVLVWALHVVHSVRRRVHGSVEFVSPTLPG